MEGYAKLADLMGSDQTDGHYLIFQKFESLSAQNLLYLQAELINLQESLGTVAKGDSESQDPEKLLFNNDWEVLSTAIDSVQWQTWLEIRAKLKEYYEAIARHRMITVLPAPSSHDLKFLQQWLERPNLGNCSLVGADSDVYEKHKETGLMTLVARGREDDAMTRLLVHTLPKMYHYAIAQPLHRLCGWLIKKPMGLPSHTEGSSAAREESQPEVPQVTEELSSTAVVDTIAESYRNMNNQDVDLESNVFLYRDSQIYRVATILGTLLSSLIPIAAIIVLSFVKNMTARLGIVSVFTAMFSVVLSLVTEGRRVEIFAATAAFASVQVVFIGSTNWSQG